MIARFSRQAALALAGLALSLAAPAQATSPIRHLDLAPVRDYGIVIGETVSAHIRVSLAPGWRLDTASLPRPGSAVSEVLEIRQVDWVQTSQGDTMDDLIRVTYQVFKGVRNPETVSVPALPLRFIGDGEPVEAQAPAWAFTLNPIIPPAADDETVTLRGALPLPANPARRHWLWLGVSLAGLAVLAIHAAVRRGWLARRRPPFARAAAAIAKLAKQTPAAASQRQAAQSLHQAINAVAGFSVSAGQLEKFLQAQPRHQPAEAELAWFFALSDRLFYAVDTEPDGDNPLPRMAALCRLLDAQCP